MEKIIELLKKYEERYGLSFASIKIFSAGSGLLLDNAISEDEHETTDFHDVKELKNLLKTS